MKYVYGQYINHMRKIIKNAIQCKLCGEIIESTDRHQYVTCNFLFL